MTDQERLGYDTRRAAVRDYWFVRLTSFLAFVVVGGGVWWLTWPLLSGYAIRQWAMLVPGFVFAWVLISATPLYDLLGLFVVWTGRVPRSCPYCLASHAPRLRVAHDVCSGCGREAWQVQTGERLGGWIYYSPSGTDGRFAYCSGECREAGDEL